MEFVLFIAACSSVLGICVCINSAAQELRGIRSVLETHANLEPVKVRAYQRRENGGAQL
jgi:hypothetical protein